MGLRGPGLLVVLLWCVVLCVSVSLSAELFSSVGVGGGLLGPIML